jgi:transposase-like protein
MIQQNHSRIKRRVQPMLRFQGFDTAPITIIGFELAAPNRQV